MQEEFDALWGSTQAVPLAEAVVLDIKRLGERRVVEIDAWAGTLDRDDDPAAAVIETPVYRTGRGAVGAPKSLRENGVRRPPGPHWQSALRAR